MGREPLEIEEVEEEEGEPLFCSKRLWALSRSPSTKAPFDWIEKGPI